MTDWFQWSCNHIFEWIPATIGQNWVKFPIPTLNSRLRYQRQNDMWSKSTSTLLTTELLKITGFLSTYLTSSTPSSAVFYKRLRIVTFDRQTWDMSRKRVSRWYGQLTLRLFSRIKTWDKISGSAVMERRYPEEFTNCQDLCQVPALVMLCLAEQCGRSFQLETETAMHLWVTAFVFFFNLLDLVW